MKAPKRCLATYTIAGSFGIEVLGIDFRNETVTWKWSNDNAEHESMFKTIAGKVRFRANRIWVPLDECIQI